MSEQCKALRLTSLATALPSLLEQARQTQPTYATFLEQALQVELDARKQRAEERRRRAAHLPTLKTLDAFDFGFQPSIPERVIRELAGLAFVQTATNIVFLGPPGVGKTHLSLALSLKALEAGHTVLFTTLKDLAEGIEGGGAALPFQQRLRRYVVPRVLVIDEVGYRRLTSDQASALFELVTARYEKGAIILTSNTSFAEWGTLLGNEVLASALLDRLLHHAEVMSIQGPSYRMKERSEVLRPASVA
jgi:DNA replication protein DnaC